MHGLCPLRFHKSSVGWNYPVAQQYFFHKTLIFPVSLRSVRRWALNMKPSLRFLADTNSPLCSPAPSKFKVFSLDHIFVSYRALFSRKDSFTWPIFYRTETSEYAERSSNIPIAYERFTIDFSIGPKKFSPYVLAGVHTRFFYYFVRSSHASSSRLVNRFKRHFWFPLWSWAFCQKS